MSLYFKCLFMAREASCKLVSLLSHSFVDIISAIIESDYVMFVTLNPSIWIVRAG
jgi:hypothetical protein